MHICIHIRKIQSRIQVLAYHVPVFVYIYIRMYAHLYAIYCTMCTVRVCTVQYVPKYMNVLFTRHVLV